MHILSPVSTASGKEPTELGAAEQAAVVRDRARRMCSSLLAQEAKPDAGAEAGPGGESELAS